MTEATILKQVKEHQQMAAYHSERAYRLIESLGSVGAATSGATNKILSKESKAKLISKVNKTMFKNRQK